MPDGPLPNPNPCSPEPSTQPSFRAEVKRVQDLAKKDGVASRAYRAAFAEFMATLYIFGKKHFKNTDLIDFYLNERNLIGERGRQAPYWNRVVKLAIAEQAVEGTWEYDRDKASMYGRVLAHAEERGVDESDAASYFSSGFKVRLQEAREAAPRHTRSTLPSKSLNKLKQQVGRLLSNSSSLTIDMAAAGLKPGKHKLFAEVLADGKLEFIAVLPASEQSVIKELEKSALI